MKRKRIIIAVSVLLEVLSIALFTLCGCNPSDEYTAEKTAKRDAYAILNAQAVKGQFVMIGDSVVELFRTEYFKDAELAVYNRGISGDTSYQMYDRLESNALSSSPSVVFILVGANDMSYGKSAEFIAESIMKSVDKCLESGVKKVIVGSLLPVNKSLDSELIGRRSNDTIKEINRLLVSVCSETEGAVFVDLHSTVVDKDGNFDSELTYDGLHPNVNGYLRLTEAIKPLI